MKKPKNKVLSVFLSLLLVFPNNMINHFSSAENPSVETILSYGDPWDGSYESDISTFMDGKVVSIETPGQFIGFAIEFNKETSTIPQDCDVKLMKSLDFGEITETSDGQSLTVIFPIGTERRHFKGKFGSNTSAKAGIKNLTLKNDEGEDVGFFGVTEHVGIHDLYLDSSVKFEANGLQYKMVWEYDRNEKNGDPNRKNAGNCGFILETIGKNNTVTNVSSYATFASNGAEGRAFLNRCDWDSYSDPKLTNSWRDRRIERMGMNYDSYKQDVAPTGLSEYIGAVDKLYRTPFGIYGQKHKIPKLDRTLICGAAYIGNLWNCGSTGRDKMFAVKSPDFRLRVYTLSANRGDVLRDENGNTVYITSLKPYYTLKQNIPDNCALGSLKYTVTWDDCQGQTHTIAKTIAQNDLQEVMQLRVPAEVPSGAKVKLEGTLFDPADSDKYQVIGCENFKYLNPDDPCCTAVVAVIPLDEYLSKTDSSAWQRVYMVDIIPESRQLLPEEFSQLKYVSMPNHTNIFLDKNGNKVTEMDDGQNIYDFITENCPLENCSDWQRRNRSLAYNSTEERLKCIEENSPAVCAIKDAYELPDGGSRYNVCVNNETDPELLFDEPLTKDETSKSIPKVNILQSINYLFGENQQEWENVFNGGNSGDVGFVTRANGQTYFTYCTVHGSVTSKAGNALIMIRAIQMYDDEQNEYFIKEEDGHEGFSAKTSGGNSGNVGSLVGQSNNKIRIESCANHALIKSAGGETEIPSTVNGVFSFEQGTSGHAGGFVGDASYSGDNEIVTVVILCSGNYGDVFASSNKLCVGANAGYAGGAIGFSIANVMIIGFINYGNVNADGSSINFANLKSNSLGTGGSISKKGHTGMKGCTCAANGGNGGSSAGTIGGSYSKKITIKKVANSGKISADGGIVGYAVDAHNQGKFGNGGNAGVAGGIIGENNSSIVMIEDGKNTGEISANGGDTSSPPPYVGRPHVENYNGGHGGCGGNAGAGIGKNSELNSNVDINVFINSGNITANGGSGGCGMAYTLEEKSGNGGAAGLAGNAGVAIGYTNTRTRLNSILNTGSLYSNGSNSGDGGRANYGSYEYSKSAGDASKTAGMGGNVGVIGFADVDSILNLSYIFNLGHFYANGGSLGLPGTVYQAIPGRTPYLFGEGTGGNVGTIGYCKSKDAHLDHIYISPDSIFEVKSNVFGCRAGVYGGGIGRFEGSSVDISDFWNCTGSVDASNSKTQSAGSSGSVFGYLAPTSNVNVYRCTCSQETFNSGVGKISIRNLGLISSINKRITIMPQEKIKLPEEMIQRLNALKQELGVE